MQRIWFVSALLFVASCAEGGIIGGGDRNDPDNAMTGGPADCISGVTCPDEDCIDNDNDGFGAGCILGPDCDDTDAQRAPNASETCDSKDNNCDGRIDEGDICDTPPPSNNTTTPGCADTDGDGHGVGCTTGSDCDDSDPQRFDGAPEACDGKDNDCDGTIDEGFEISMACTAGLGACEAAGQLGCSSDGTMADCSAQAGSPQTEVCDSVDNDCDGMVDEGLNCSSCTEDGNEPDDSSLTGTTLTAGSVSGQLCPADADWFRLGTYTAGQSVSVTALFSHAQGDIDMDMYVGSTFEAVSNSTSDNESITQTLSKSGAVTVRLYYTSAPGVPGNSYTIQR